MNMFTFLISYFSSKNVFILFLSISLFTFCSFKPKLETVETVEWHLSISEDDKPRINISKSCLLLALYRIQQNGAVAGDGCDCIAIVSVVLSFVYNVYIVYVYLYIFTCTCLLVYVHQFSLLVYNYI